MLLGKSGDAVAQGGGGSALGVLSLRGCGTRDVGVVGWVASEGSSNPNDSAILRMAGVSMRCIEPSLTRDAIVK